MVRMLSFKVGSEGGKGGYLAFRNKVKPLYEFFVKTAEKFFDQEALLCTP